MSNSTLLFEIQTRAMLYERTDLLTQAVEKLTYTCDVLSRRIDALENKLAKVAAIEDAHVILACDVACCPPECAGCSPDDGR